MDKLNQLLTGNVLDFAASFGAATRDWDEAPAPGYPLWLEGWVAPARAGYVLGDGEFIHNGAPRRFYFSGMPMRLDQGTRLSGAGTISGLRVLRDFSGIYLPWEGSSSRAAGYSESCLRNCNGVVIAFRASGENQLIELPYGGLRVRLATDS